MRVHRFRAVVVDDEALARQRLVEFLSDEPEIELVGEAGSGSKAVELIANKRPDIVFLDVQMPGLDGFGVLRSIARSSAPLVVFVTAYDEYAIRAFEVQAVDYVLKPVTKARLRNATQRAITRLRTQMHADERAAENASRIAAVLATVPEVDSGPRIPIRADGHTEFVSVASINWIEARGDNLELHTARGTRKLRQTMTEILYAIPSSEFVRVHRSYIVRISRVTTIHSVLRGGYELTLSDGAKIPVGRTFRDVVRETFRQP